MRTATARKLTPITDSDLSGRSHGLRLVSGSEVSDYTLAQQAAGGAMVSMGDLYERHYWRVYSVCLNMTRNPADAEDLTQEVFVHLVRKIGLFRGDSRFTTWLHRLTVNLVLMHFRRNRSCREHTPEELERIITLSQRAWQPANAQLVDRVTLDAALAHLPAGCRSVFVLFEIVGYRHDEISRLLGCSVGTSKSQLHRARKKLRRSLRSASKKKPIIAY